MPHKISAIVLTYNQQNTVGRTIDSMLAQDTDYPVEIIIGEDCSTDSTRTVCEEYVKKYPEKIKLMPKAPNKGVVGNFVDCLRECDGEFVSLCAGDDWWSDPCKLRKQADFLLNNHDCIVVHGEMKHYDINTQTVQTPRIRSNVPEGNVLEELYFRPFVNAPTAFIRLAALQSVNFDLWLKEGFVMEDLPMWLELAPKGKFHFMPEYFTTYSIGGESISRSNITSRKLAFERETFKIKFFYFHRDNPGFPLKRLERLFRKRLITIALRSGDREAIRQISAEAGTAMTLYRRAYISFRKLIGKK